MSGSRTQTAYRPHRRNRRPLSYCKLPVETGCPLAERDMDRATRRPSYRVCRRDRFPNLAKSRKVVRRRR